MTKKQIEQYRTAMARIFWAVHWWSMKLGRCVKAVAAAVEADAREEAAVAGVAIIKSPQVPRELLCVL